MYVYIYNKTSAVSGLGERNAATDSPKTKRSQFWSKDPLQNLPPHFHFRIPLQGKTVEGEEVVVGTHRHFVLCF